MSEIATYLKVGTAGVVLSMIEDGYIVSHMELDDPVKAIREIARDTTLKRKIKLEDGRELTAIEIQRVYLERAKEYLGSLDDEPVAADVVRRWEDILDRMEEDPMQLCHELDWVVKKRIMLEYMDKKGCGWDDPRITMMDLQYHDVKRTRGLYYLLERQELVERPRVRFTSWYWRSIMVIRGSSHPQPFLSMYSSMIRFLTTQSSSWQSCMGSSSMRSEEHTSELQSRPHLVCRLLLEKKKNKDLMISAKQRYENLVAPRVNK